MKKSKVMVMLALVLVCLMAFAACTPTTPEPAEESAAPEESAAVEESAAPEESAAVEESAAPEESADAEATVAAGAESFSAILPTSDELLPQIPDGETISVGYLAQNETDQFCVYMGEAIKDEAAKYGDKVELELSDGMGVAATQVSQAENMVVKGVDVVIISAIDQDACAPAVQAVVDAGIPIIILNTVVSNTDIATAYVGVDDVEAGVVAMEVVSEGIGGEGTVNVILGQLGHPASENRWTGVQAALEEYPGIEIGASQAADWDRNKAMNVTEDWISGGVDFQGLLALNDEMAISASNALAAAGVEDVVIVGVDALDEALQLIKEGKMYGTVFQDADAQGRGSLNVAIAAALGLDVDKEYLIPFQPVTAANVDDYMGIYS